MSSEKYADAYNALELSVLDLVPVRSGQSSRDAVAATVSLARLAEDRGYKRFWIAEHHNMPASAATDPAVFVAILAAATRTIRVGSGAVLLSNQSSLAVAERFALLEAAHPGRIDLGVGRASGTDPLTRAALGEVSGDVAEVDAYLSPAGASIVRTGHAHRIRATPSAASRAPVWLLGASQDSALRAARLGLPYVFGYHLGVRGAASALRIYRDEFIPTPSCPSPRTLLPVIASVADTAEEAHRAARPWLLLMLGLYLGRPQTPVLTVEEAARVTLSPADEKIAAAISERWIIGDAVAARAEIAALARHYDVDEVMVHPVSGSSEDADPTTAPGRERTLHLLSQKEDRA